MPGIYIHIPFCKRKCHYCNFFSLASLKYRERFLDALNEEIFLEKNFLGNKPVESIYLGGGTPSYIRVSEISGILTNLKKYYAFAENIEITLEANPDDINPEMLGEYLELGINRLSIGVQSFFEEDLVYLNRIHSAERAIESVREAKEAGFSNISIDLIYGIPTLTLENWNRNLEIAFSLDVPHVSAYALTVEPKTPLDLMIRKGKLPAPEEEQVVEHFRILMQRMKAQGFEHYEISNFCKDGSYSRHNSMYWNGSHYLGLGPSAHSYNGTTRRWNVSNLFQYIDQIQRNDRFYESEELTDAQRYNEYVMVTLRTMWGCDLGKIRNDFGEETALRFSSLAIPFIEAGQIIQNDAVYFLTDEGKLSADGIASELFLEP